MAPEREFLRDQICQSIIELAAITEREARLRETDARLFESTNSCLSESRELLARVDIRSQ